MREETLAALVTKRPQGGHYVTSGDDGHASLRQHSDLLGHRCCIP